MKLKNNEHIFDNNLNTTNDLGQKKSILLIETNFITSIKIPFQVALNFNILKTQNIKLYFSLTNEKDRSLNAVCDRFNY